MKFKHVLQFALLSVLLTLILAVTWEFLIEQGLLGQPGLAHAAENDASRWVHVMMITVFAAVAVSILSLFTLRLITELNDKERTLRQTEQERLSFAADAAHELRTPLAVLRAHLDILDNKELTQQLRQDVDHITRIVEQVLAKSRIEAIDVKAGETVDLSQLAASMAAYLAPLIIKEGRSVEVVGAEQPVVINANAFAVEQALRNLMENAMKYSARGSTITIEVGCKSKACTLSVIDQGRGVPHEERELIFERFRRADQRGSGSGLGLSIVRRVAEAHGGNVTVEDAPGGGAVFTLHFARS